MQNNKNFSENWVVLIGIFLLFVAFYKYKTNNDFEKKYLKENNTVQTQTNLISQRITASEKKMSSTVQSNTDNKLEFTNSKSRFNKAMIYKEKFDRTPAQLNSKVFLVEHRLLQSTPWKIWVNTQVVKKENAPIGHSLANIHNFSIIESEDNMNLTEFDTNKAIAVFDERLKKPGLITGTLKVQTSNKSRLQTDLKNYQAQITDEFENIETYFIKSSQPIFNLELLYQTLKNQDYINSVEIEILSKNYVKN
jgi:hypothetical protein